MITTGVYSVVNFGASSPSRGIVSSAPSAPSSADSGRLGFAVWFLLGALSLLRFRVHIFFSAFIY